MSSHFILNNDLDCTAATSEGGSLWNDGAGFQPIGACGTVENQSLCAFEDYSYLFTGSFNGNNKTITDLYINRPTRNDIGLFGGIRNASIRNVTINNADMTGRWHVGGLVGYIFQNGSIINAHSSGTFTAEYQVGGLVGYSYGNISNSSSSGIVEGLISALYHSAGGLVGHQYNHTISNSFSSAAVSGNRYVGGLVGQNQGALIENSYATGNVQGIVTTGGFVGTNSYGSDAANINQSYSTGNVSVLGNDPGAWQMGGFAGFNESFITNCYALGNVSISTGDEAGGFIGRHAYNEIKNSYSTGAVTIGVVPNWAGAFAGKVDDETAVITASFWNRDTSILNSKFGLSSYQGGNVFNKTTQQLQSLATFTSELGAIPWNFDTIWGIDATNNNGYPYFRWQYQEEEQPVEDQPVENNGSGNNTSFSNSQPNSSDSRSSSASSCTAAKPTGIPDLFQISTFRTQATLYFTPVTSNANRYTIIYGYLPGDERFATTFENADSSGVISHTINHLFPNSTFYFKVRANNGCSVGEWSNWLKAKTSRSPQTPSHFYRY